MPAPKREFSPFVGKIFGIVPEHDFADHPPIAFQVDYSGFAAGRNFFAEFDLLRVAVSKVYHHFVHVNPGFLNGKLEGGEPAFAGSHENFIAIKPVIDLSFAQFFPSGGDCVCGIAGERHEGKDECDQQQGAGKKNEFFHHDLDFGPGDHLRDGFA